MLDSRPTGNIGRTERYRDFGLEGVGEGEIRRRNQALVVRKELSTVTDMTSVRKEKERGRTKGGIRFEAVGFVHYMRRSAKVVRMQSTVTSTAEAAEQEVIKTTMIDIETEFGYNLAGHRMLTVEVVAEAMNC